MGLEDVAATPKQGDRSGLGGLHRVQLPAGGCGSHAPQQRSPLITLCWGGLPDAPHGNEGTSVGGLEEHSTRPHPGGSAATRFQTKLIHATRRVIVKNKNELGGSHQGVSLEKVFQTPRLNLDIISREPSLATVTLVVFPEWIGSRSSLPQLKMCAVFPWVYDNLSNKCWVKPGSYSLFSGRIPCLALEAYLALSRASSSTPSGSTSIDEGSPTLWACCSLLKHHAGSSPTRRSA